VTTAQLNCTELLAERTHWSWKTEEEEEEDENGANLMESEKDRMGLLLVIGDNYFYKRKFFKQNLYGKSKYIKFFNMFFSLVTTY
jgi:hypothetical protein